MKPFLRELQLQSTELGTFSKLYRLKKRKGSVVKSLTWQEMRPRMASGIGSLKSLRLGLNQMKSQPRKRHQQLKRSKRRLRKRLKSSRKRKTRQRRRYKRILSVKIRRLRRLRRLKLLQLIRQLTRSLLNPRRVVQQLVSL